MKKHLKLGKKGEDAACEYLLKKGYDIVDRNWRYKRAEIDIVIRKDELLIFIEVKTRSHVFFGTPDAFVGEKKKRLIADAAMEFMKLVGHSWAFRFDIIAVVSIKNNFQINHFEDAFFPGIK